MLSALMDDVEDGTIALVMLKIQTTPLKRWRTSVHALARRSHAPE